MKKCNYFNRIGVAQKAALAITLPFQMLPVAEGDTQPENIEVSDISCLCVRFAGVGETGIGKPIETSGATRYELSGSAITVHVAPIAEKGEAAIIIDGKYGQVKLHAKIVLNVGDGTETITTVSPYVFSAIAAGGNKNSTPLIVDGKAQRGIIAISGNQLVVSGCLDSIALDGKTYRQIFEDGNILGITPSFSSGNFSPMVINVGNPSVEVGVYNEKNALKCYGQTSQQIRSVNLLPKTLKYTACFVNCTRYVAGKIGVPVSFCEATLSRVTSGWEFVSAIEKKYIHNVKGFVGSSNSANLDGYVAFPICLDLSMFDEMPTKEQLDSVYNKYVELAIVESGRLQLTLNGEVKHEQSESIIAFVNKMNEYAKDFGMLNTHFVNASGMHHSNHYSTASDIVRLCAACTKYEKLMRYWGLLNYNVNVGGSHARTISGLSTYKGEVMRSVGDYYHIFGGKSGSWTIDGFVNKNLTLAVKSKADNTWLIGCIMRSEVDDRGVPLKQLLDWLEDYRTNPSAPMPTIDATYAAAAVLPPVSAMAYADVDIIDVNKSGNTQFLPASMTKLMTALVVLDYCDLSETLTIENTDIKSGSGDTFYAGDTLSVRDAIIAMLLPSSNTLATAFSRFVGNKILNK